MKAWHVLVVSAEPSSHAAIYCRDSIVRVVSRVGRRVSVPTDNGIRREANRTPHEMTVEKPPRGDSIVATSVATL